MEENRNIWQRVAPTLEPYPSGSAELPGAERNPCCMGSEAAASVEVIAGYIEAAESDRRYLMALAGQGPSWARSALRGMASAVQGQGRRLAAAYYLITGQSYRASMSMERIYTGRWLPALRERYHAAACSALNYERSAEGTADPCLARLFQTLSRESYAHAETLMTLLERQLAAQG